MVHAANKYIYFLNTGHHQGRLESSAVLYRQAKETCHSELNKTRKWRVYKVTEGPRGWRRCSLNELLLRNAIVNSLVHLSLCGWCDPLFGRMWLFTPSHSAELPSDNNWSAYFHNTFMKPDLYQPSFSIPAILLTSFRSMVPHLRRLLVTASMRRPPSWNFHQL